MDISPTLQHEDVAQRIQDAQRPDLHEQNTVNELDDVLAQDFAAKLKSAEATNAHGNLDFAAVIQEVKEGRRSLPACMQGLGLVACEQLLEKSNLTQEDKNYQEDLEKRIAQRVKERAEAKNKEVAKPSTEHAAEKVTTELTANSSQLNHQEKELQLSSTSLLDMARKQMEDILVIEQEDTSRADHIIPIVEDDAIYSESRAVIDELDVATSQGLVEKDALDENDATEFQEEVDPSRVTASDNTEQITNEAELINDKLPISDEVKTDVVDWNLTQFFLDGDIAATDEAEIEVSSAFHLGIDASLDGQFTSEFDDQQHDRAAEQQSNETLSILDQIASLEPELSILIEQDVLSTKTKELLDQKSEQITMLIEYLQTVPIYEDEMAEIAPIEVLTIALQELFAQAGLKIQIERVVTIARHLLEQRNGEVPASQNLKSQDLTRKYFDSEGRHEFKSIKSQLSSFQTMTNSISQFIGYIAIQLHAIYKVTSAEN